MNLRYQIRSLLNSSQNKLATVIQKLPIKSEILGPPKGFYRFTSDFFAMSSLSSQGKIMKNFVEDDYGYKIYSKLPNSIDENIYWKFIKVHETYKIISRENKRKNIFSETFVAIVTDGRVWGNSGAIITPDDKLLADVSFDFVRRDAAHRVFYQWKLPRIYKVNGTVAVLSVAGGVGYYHWMFDLLPRIELLRRSELDISCIDKFLVNSYQLPFHKETLNILGIRAEKIIESSQYPHIKATRLVVPSLAGNVGNMPQWVCKFLRREFLTRMKPEKLDIPKRIYISRAKASWRRVVNEDEVLNFLSIHLGFKSIVLESMSVVEQASLFSSAQVVVSAHGAGLANTVFCNPGTKVIEFLSPNYVNLMYWALSNQMSIEYYYLFGKGERHNQYTEIHNVGEDIAIEINSLQHIMSYAKIV
ncbi:glycosyltransferase family 61 protein [Coleofasciculus sp. E1-EBD-02]|uniref:glycosyltransferase family 61 protein n=1 Tax=Coleofasciculus sp. E1-EBD-02 TaxID=3068481 RepID=UPI003302E2CD